MDVSLKGKVVLVTGGSRGIGKATVRLLRQAEARVVFSYRARAEEAARLADECGGDACCVALQHELNCAADGRDLVRQAVEVFGRIDALVANHGVWPAHDQPIGSMPDEQWQGTLAVNLDSVFGLVSEASAQMLAQPSAATGRLVFGNARRRGLNSGTRVCGHIVLVASTAAQRGEAGHADYAASKGALLSLTKSLSSELAPRGVLCNCVAPGWVRTEMSAGTLDDPEAAAAAFALIPLGRAAEPEEIAGPIVFLLSPWAGFCSGEIFNVNGGAVLAG